MAIAFPSNPTIGQTFTSSGKSWVWNGAQWESSIVVQTPDNFVINVGSSTGNTYTLDKEYPAGGYAVSSGTNDVTLDIYLLNSSNTLVGKSSTRGITANYPFSKVIILGQQQNDILTFVYSGSAFSSTVSGNNPTAAAYITSISPTSLPNINDSVAITGGNFANDVLVYFIGSDLNYRLAKSVVKSSTTSIIAVRPNDLPVAYGPYTIYVENVGVPIPVGSNVHKIDNAISPGTLPSWTSPSQINYDTSSAFSYSLTAPDQELSNITFSIVSGTLPTGLSLNSSTGVISGTPTQNQKNTVVFRATDAGGNYVDKSIIVCYSPVWTVSSLPVSFTDVGSTYSFTLTSTDANSAAITYSIVSGSLPTGLTLNSSTGNISGSTSTTSTSNITIRATATGYGWKDRSFTLESRAATKAIITSTQNWTAPAGVTSVKVFTVAGGGGGYAYGGNNSVAGTGGGAGGAISQNVSVTPGQSYAVVVGAGGSGGTSPAAGSNSSFSGSVIANGGGAAGVYYGVGGNGGCGGGGWTAGGTASQGFAGGKGSNGQYAAGGGGGMGAVGGDAGGNNGGNGGAGILYLGSYYAGGGGAGNSSGGSAGSGGSGGGGAGNGSAGTANTGGGGGGSNGASSSAGAGGSGVVVIAY